LERETFTKEAAAAADRVELLQNELAAARETIREARANTKVWFTSVAKVE
jgi:hypothetical protein